MVRAVRRVALLAILLGALGDPASNTQDGLDERLAHVRELLDGDGERLESVGRRLQSASIYGASGSTRAYSSTEEYAGALGHMWLIICGALVMFMQAGFAMYRAGCVRVRNVQAVMLNGLLDLSIGTLCWWIFGWGFAWSGPYQTTSSYKKNFAGSWSFAGHHFLQERNDGQQEPTADIVRWFFTWATSIVAVTIAGGGLAERAHWAAYSIYVFIMSSFIFPLVVAWTWGRGYLMEMNFPGYSDTAGSGIIHLTGGFAALVGCVFVGARDGVFEGQDAKERATAVKAEEFIPHSQPLITMGSFILWFGWYGLNCGIVGYSGLTSVEVGMLAAQAAMNTTLAASCGGLTAFMLRFAMKKRNDTTSMCFGVLSGLVAISGCCSSVECGTAVGIGIGAGFVFVGASAILKILKIDDPVEAFAIHGANGLWGVFCAALMDWGNGFNTFHGRNGFRCFKQTGSTSCYEDGTKAVGNVFAANIVMVLAILGWAVGISLIVFGMLKLTRLLRVGEECTAPGIDRKKHIPPRGYNFGAAGQGEFGLHSI